MWSRVMRTPGKLPRCLNTVCRWNTTTQTANINTDNVIQGAENTQQTAQVFKLCLQVKHNHTNHKLQHKWYETWVIRTPGKLPRCSNTVRRRKRTTQIINSNISDVIQGGVYCTKQTAQVLKLELVVYTGMLKRQWVYRFSCLYWYTQSFPESTSESAEIHWRELLSLISMVDTNETEYTLAPNTKGNFFLHTFFRKT